MTLPSARMAKPVMTSTPPDATNQVSLATSSGVPSRFTRVERAESVLALRTSSTLPCVGSSSFVSTGPGQMQFDTTRRLDAPYGVRRVPDVENDCCAAARSSATRNGLTITRQVRADWRPRLAEVGRLQDILSAEVDDSSLMHRRYPPIRPERITELVPRNQLATARNKQLECKRCLGKEF